MNANALLAKEVEWVKGEAHDAELLVAATPESIKLVQLVKRSIKETPLRLSGSHHECRTGHISINLLYNEIIRSFALILVGTLARHLLLPFLLTFQILRIPLSDILHDIPNRLIHRRFTCARTSQQTSRKRSLMHYIINIPEARLPEMRSERREDCVRHSRLINLRCPRYQQFHQLRQFLRHLRRFGIILLATLNSVTLNLEH